MNEGLVAIIPARAGSKRLPGKNMRMLEGKPLIQWTIDVANEAGCFDAVIVTSDSREVLELASSLGCFTVSRPVELAQDTSASADAVLHAVKVFRDNGGIVSQIMLLQPTSPLRNKDDVLAAVELKKRTSALSIISVCEVDHSPLWMNTLDSEHCMDDFLNAEVLNERSQDLPTYYRLNGAIYLTGITNFEVEKGFFIKNSRALIMPAERSIDIDTSLDFKLAECLKKGAIEE